MSPILLNARFWWRIAAVASCVWVLAILIVSAVVRNFQWTVYPGAVGPAFITASVGVLVILVICAGIPWIAEATSKER